MLGVLPPRRLGSACQPCAWRDTCGGAGRDRNAAWPVDADDGSDRWRAADPVPAGADFVSACAILRLIMPVWVWFVGLPHR